MATPAAGSPGNNKAFLDGTVVTLPVLVDATHNQIEWNEVEYKIDQYASAKQGAALSYPVTIDSTHNQFEFNEQEYVIAAGVFPARLGSAALCRAINASIQVGDSSRFDTVAVATPGVGGTILFTSVAKTSVLAFGTGASNDCVTRLGLADLDAFAAVPYPHLSLFVNALNAALDVSTGVIRLDTVVKASKSPFTLGAIRFTAVAAGANTQAIGTGASNDIVASIGFTDTQALAGGASAIVTGVSLASTLTTDQTPPTAAAIAGNARPLVWLAVPTLQASWATKTGYQAAQYSKSPEGLVRLRGVIDTGTKAAGTLITTLPAGFRPLAKTVFSTTGEVAATSNNAGELVVDTDGTVKVGATDLTASSFITLAGIVFDAVS